MTVLINQASVLELNHSLNSRNGYDCGYGPARPAGSGAIEFGILGLSLTFGK